MKQLFFNKKKYKKLVGSKQFLLGALLFLVFSSCQKKEITADLIITNANIWTGDEKQPKAAAIAISGDTILAVGSNQEIKIYEGGHTMKRDVQGQFMVPGFIDCHVHFFMGGFNLTSVKLREAKTPLEFVQRIKDFTQKVPVGTWINGGEWDHENWGGELPSRFWIDSISPNHPVWVTRLDGHMGLANSLAMKLAGITEKTADVFGGVLVRNTEGQLTGVFKDKAKGLIEDKIPPPSDELTDLALENSMNYVAANGVTTVHHMCTNETALRRANVAKRLKTRIYAMYELNRWETLKADIKEHGVGDKWLKFGGLKGYVDGSLGSHTAAFHEHYTDTPDDKGFFVNEEAQLYEWIRDADKAGLQVMIHAIGDKAIHAILNVFEEVGIENGPKDRRFRVEHTQHLAASDVPRFAALEVIPSMQPYHAIDDGRWAERVIGPERSKLSYAFKSLLDAKAKVVFGSDWFIAPANPLEGIYAAVTRRTLDGKNPNGWIPQEKITVEQALVAYTRDAAYASFEEDLKGTLSVGKLADFVLLDKDITQIPLDQIRETKVLATYVGGKEVFKLQK